MRISPLLRLLAVLGSIGLFFSISLTAQKTIGQTSRHDPGPELLLTLTSREIMKVSGSLEIPVHLTALADLDLSGWELGIAMPPALSAGEPVLVALPGRKLKAGASIQKTITLRYDPTNLPFHHQRLKLGMHHPDGDQWSSVTIAYVYFTPYGTIEFWNETDFDNLKRVWISRIGGNGRRQALSRKEVPVSDLSDAEFVDDNFPRTYVFKEGLAYGVPMRTAAAPKSGSAKKGNTYSGKISGRIITVIPNDTIMDTIALTNIRVDVHNKKGGKIETTWTDSLGHYEIDASTISLDGDSLELYVEVQSINEEETIRVRGRGLGPTRKEFYLKKTPFTWHYLDGDVDMGDIDTDEQEIKGQLLHWANRARVFVEQELSDAGFSFPTQAGQKLEIMTHPWKQSIGAMFMPAHIEVQLQLAGAIIPFPLSLLGAIALENNLSNKDCLYIGEDSELGDGTVSHEFGHYLMWHLQQEGWAGLFEAGLAMHTWQANDKTADLAWTEGFANGFSDIMEAVNALQGHAPVSSLGLQSDIQNLDDQDNPEDIIYVIDIGGGNTRNGQALDHGYVSEYYVGQLIYDLWDGPGKMTAGGLTDQSFDDEVDGLIQDSIELDFLTIVQPILDHPRVGGGPGLLGFGQGASVINSMPEYHRRLLFEQDLDCLERKELHELFYYDKIRNIKDGPMYVVDQHLLNLDAISYTGLVETDQYDIVNNGGAAFKEAGTYSEYFTMDVPELWYPEGSYNCYGLGPDAGSVLLMDDLKVAYGARLYFNKDDLQGWLDVNNLYGQSPNLGTSPPTQLLNVDICRGMVLEVADNSALILGDSLANLKAEVHFQAGSTLILGTGSSLKITPGSRLIIEPGATFIYQRGAKIVLSRENSILQIEGEWIIDEGAVFSFDGWGFVRTNLPDNNGGPNIIHRKGSSIALVGNQKEEHKILEVVAGSHFTTQYDSCQMSVRFEEGIVEMGNSAQINLTDCAVSLHRAWVRGFGDGRHKGILVNRATREVFQTDFEDGSVGLELFMDPIKMKCQTQAEHAVIATSSFSDCGFGLFTHGGSADIGGTIFQRNGTGWLAEDLQGDCAIGSIEAMGNGTAAFDLHGNGMPHLVEVEYSYIYANGTGLKGINALVMDLQCDSIAGNGIGILVGLNSSLLMNNEAYNYVGANYRTIALDNALNINLDNGYNFLDNYRSGPMGYAPFVIEGRLIATPAVNPIPAAHNYWRSSVIPPPAFPVVSVQPTSAIINVWLGSSTATKYDFSDPTPLAAPVGGPDYCRTYGVGSNPFPGSLQVAPPSMLPASTIDRAQLGQNAPNPGRNATTISYYLPAQTKEAQILVFDLVSGRRIRTFSINERGSGKLQLERNNMGAGVYGYSLLVDGQLVDTKKLVWMD